MAREAGLYTNLITSGIGLTEKRIAELDAAGLDHVQLSLQGTDAAMADRIGGYKGGFDRKMQVAGWLGEAGFPLTLNFVMHRHNMHQLERALEMARRDGGAAHRDRHGAVPRLGDAEPRRPACRRLAQAQEAGRQVVAAREAAARHAGDRLRHARTTTRAIPSPA